MIAAADELTIAHPSAEPTVATTAVILGGPALYLAGNALFKWELWEYVPPSRLVAILALGVLVPLALVSRQRSSFTPPRRRSSSPSRCGTCGPNG